MVDKLLFAGFSVQLKHLAGDKVPKKWGGIKILSAEGTGLVIFDRFQHGLSKERLKRASSVAALVSERSSR